MSRDRIHTASASPSAEENNLDFLLELRSNWGGVVLPCRRKQLPGHTAGSPVVWAPAARECCRGCFVLLVAGGLRCCGRGSSMAILFQPQVDSPITLQLQHRPLGDHWHLPAILGLPRTAFMLLTIIWEPYIRILSVAILLSFSIPKAAGYIHQYNSLNGQPDVLKTLYSALQPSSTLEDLRYYDGGRLSDQQMALLQYQRENLHYLSEEVLRLQECLSKYERSDDGSTPQVDLAHLLAARDQELRALSAEMNQVASELRLARSLIADRDSEIQKVRVTNSQYVEENERLRAILGEWSARAAKLEKALDTERSSNMELQKKIEILRSQIDTHSDNGD
ncbi:hypothetical protein Taro_020260 [Colocasia esculenta]|uniref:Uncharacterized protein n=1 Tax=Colocasia esculenta TaxID=4460 RepID=A0A843V7Y9_COLES|nr:hypothetical protein [Colocasia esculenta]